MCIKPMLNRVQRIWLFLENEEYRHFDGCKIEIYDTFTKYVFWFFEPFLAHLASKFAKSANMTQKEFFWKKKDIKKTRISRWFRIRWKSCRKMHQKKLQAKQVWRTWVKVTKVHISVTFLLTTSLGAFFHNFFNGFEISVKFCVFYTHHEFFNRNFFLLLLALNVHFNCKCAGNGSKNRKIFFYECVLELGIHQRVCITKLLKSLYPNSQCPSIRVQLSIH